MNDKEVFIAKNGRPYVKDENGKVRFISHEDWQQYKTKQTLKPNGKYFLIGVLVVLVSIYIGNNIGGWI
jgi:hypothetical protein